MTTLKELEAGDRVAILTWGGKAVSESTVERMTLKQGVLTDSRKFRLEDGQILREHGKVAVMTEEFRVQLLERQAEEAKRDRMIKAQSSVRTLQEQMSTSYYKGSYYNGFTAEELESVASAMQSAIASRDLRNVSPYLENVSPYSD